MMQRIEQTMEERVAMYRKMKKKELAKMLAAANVFIDKVSERALREQFPTIYQDTHNIMGEWEYTYQCKDNDNVIAVQYLDGKPDELHISHVGEKGYTIIGYKDLQLALTAAEIALTK